MLEFWVVNALAAAIVVVAVGLLRARGHWTHTVTLQLLGIGAVGWIIAKIPKAVVVLPYMLVARVPMTPDTDADTLLRNFPGLLLVGAIAAGIFEELAKPAGLLSFKSLPRTAAAGAVIGIGAGMIEALNFVIGALLTSAPSVSVPVERLVAIAFHAGLTALVVFGFANKRYALVLVAIVTHALVDWLIPTLQIRGILDQWSAIGILAVVTALVIMLVAYLPGEPPASLAAAG